MDQSAYDLDKEAMRAANIKGELILK